jgi:glycosyltransferase involved in cell wall biosynthesis
LNAPDIDLVHIQHEYGFWGSILPGRWAYWDLRYLIEKPVVLTAHTTLSLEELLHIRSERRPHKWLAKQWLLRNREYRDGVEAAPFVTAYTIVHTEAAREELIRRGVKPTYVTVVPSGVPDPLPAPTGGRAFREKFDLGDRRILTLFGFISPNKGYELTLDLLPTLPGDVVFVIAGGARTGDHAPYQQSLETRIQNDPRLWDRVVITGFLSDEDVAEAMTASEVVLAPHTQATNSYSVTLPLAHGRPILASDLDCFRELHARMDCLELFRAGDTADYRDKLQRLLTDEERRRELAATAAKYAARYSWPNVAATTLRVYRAAIQVYNAGPHHPQLRLPGDPRGG